MRLVISLLILPFPAQAWDHTIGDICTLSHQTETATIHLTYDPAKPLYTLKVTREGGWPQSPFFGMRFDGRQPNAISTNRHVHQEDAVFVADVGFGNVLDGLQFNDTAYALTEGEFAAFPLDGAAPHVQAFRDCMPNAGV